MTYVAQGRILGGSVKADPFLVSSIRRTIIYRILKMV